MRAELAALAMASGGARGGEALEELLGHLNWAAAELAASLKALDGQRERLLVRGGGRLPSSAASGLNKLSLLFGVAQGALEVIEWLARSAPGLFLCAAPLGGALNARRLVDALAFALPQFALSPEADRLERVLSLRLTGGAAAAAALSRVSPLAAMAPVVGALATLSAAEEAVEAADARGAACPLTPGGARDATAEPQPMEVDSAPAGQVAEGGAPAAAPAAAAHEHVSLLGLLADAPALSPERLRALAGMPFAALAEPPLLAVAPYPGAPAVAALTPAAAAELAGVAALAAEVAAARDDAAHGGAAPEGLLDPLTAELMADPVQLPSGIVVDRTTAARCDGVDPYTRAPFGTAASLPADEALRARVAAFRARRRRRAA
jgi:hypothetical protein